MLLIIFRSIQNVDIEGLSSAKMVLFKSELNHQNIYIMIDISFKLKHIMISKTDEIYYKKYRICSIRMKLNKYDKN